MAVVGYPVGGDTTRISVTSGVVSRIEVTPYAHGATELLQLALLPSAHAEHPPLLSPPLSLRTRPRTWESSAAAAS